MEATSEEYYVQKLKEAYDELKPRSKVELIGILKTFNYWGWPAALGEPPAENWHGLPNYRKPWMPEDTVTKETYIKPYADAIYALGVSHWDTIEK